VPLVFTESSLSLLITSSDLELNCSESKTVWNSKVNVVRYTIYPSLQKKSAKCGCTLDLDAAIL
jgi:hypothetical protein